MKKFIIWPILVPALAFFQDETQAAQPPNQGIELDVPGTVSTQTKSAHGKWSDTDGDDFLQEPIIRETDASGTVVENDDDDDLYVYDLYGDQHPYHEEYDDQDVDDEANKDDDSDMSR